MKRNLKFLLVAAAGALFAGKSQAAALVDLSILGNTDGSSNYSNTVSVSSNQTVYFEVVGTMAALGTTNTSSGTKTINSLTLGTDGIYNLPFNLVDSTVANVPITGFTSLAFANHDNGTGSSLGSYSSNDLNNAKIVADTVDSFAPLGVVATNTPGVQVLLTGQFTTGTVTGSSSLGETFPTTLSGSFKINGGTSVVYGTAALDSGYNSWAPLTLNSASTPEPGSLSLIVLASGGLLAARRRRATLA